MSAQRISDHILAKEFLSEFKSFTSHRYTSDKFNKWYNTLEPIHDLLGLTLTKSCDDADLDCVVYKALCDTIKEVIESSKLTLSTKKDKKRKEKYSPKSVSEEKPSKKRKAEEDTPSATKKKKKKSKVDENEEQRIRKARQDAIVAQTKTIFEANYKAYNDIHDPEPTPTYNPSLASKLANHAQALKGNQ